VPAPLNPAPITGLSFSQALPLDGRRHCFSVSAVRGTGAQAVEGPRSIPACVALIDIFAPAPPAGLSPIAAEGSISLVWEANAEPDLGGYIVLRGESGGALTPVSNGIITETRFTDRDVQPGVRYVYAVTAVDRTEPQPNISAESERVDVTAR
jgi:fibronectin type 3 domain-containing protein